MGQLGLHIRLTDAELASSVSHEGYNSVMDFIINELEEAKFESGDVAEMDKSWAYIHSALLCIDPDGPLEREPEDASLAVESDAKFAIMGVEVLESSDDAYVGLTRANDVARVASALAAISMDDLRKRVSKAHLKFEAWGDAEEMAEYAAGWFPSLVNFYKDTAERGQHVIFTVNW